MSSNTKMELSLPNMDGDYYGRIEVGTNAPPNNAFLCAEAYYTVYRI